MLFMTWLKRFVDWASLWRLPLLSPLFESSVWITTGFSSVSPDSIASDTDAFIFPASISFPIVSGTSCSIAAKLFSSAASSNIPINPCFELLIAVCNSSSDRSNSFISPLFILSAPSMRSCSDVYISESVIRSITSPCPWISVTSWVKFAGFKRSAAIRPSICIALTISSSETSKDSATWEMISSPASLMASCSFSSTSAPVVSFTTDEMFTVSVTASDAFSLTVFVLPAASLKLTVLPVFVVVSCAPKSCLPASFDTSTCFFCTKVSETLFKMLSKFFAAAVEEFFWLEAFETLAAAPWVK